MYDITCTCVYFNYKWRRHCVVPLSKNINPSLVLVQPKKTCPFITEKLLMGRKESNQTNKITNGPDFDKMHLMVGHDNQNLAYVTFAKYCTLRDFLKILKKSLMM